MKLILQFKSISTKLIVTCLFMGMMQSAQELARLAINLQHLVEKFKFGT